MKVNIKVEHVVGKEHFFGIQILIKEIGMKDLGKIVIEMVLVYFIKKYKHIVFLRYILL